MHINDDLSVRQLRELISARNYYEPGLQLVYWHATGGVERPEYRCQLAYRRPLRNTDGKVVATTGAGAQTGRGEDLWSALVHALRLADAAGWLQEEFAPATPPVGADPSPAAETVPTAGEGRPSIPYELQRLAELRDELGVLRMNTLGALGPRATQALDTAIGAAELTDGYTRALISDRDELREKLLAAAAELARLREAERNAAQRATRAIAEMDAAHDRNAQ